MLGSNFSLHVL